MSAAVHPRRILVVGAGIVGLSVALRLHLDGHEVTVVDAGGPMEGCSAGNAGCLSEANLFPPATLDTLLQLPRLLGSTQGPLVIRPRYLRTMLPWMAHAASALVPSRNRHIVAAMAGITAPALASFDALTAASGTGSLITRQGLLVACRTSRTLAARSARMALWKQSGIAVERVDAGQMREIAPALRADLAGGLFFTRSGRCSDPRQLGLGYAARLRAGGAAVLRAEVRALRAGHDAAATVFTSQGELQADKVVVCAGFASRALLAPWDCSVPLAAERGYHLMLAGRQGLLDLPVIFGEPYFAATPMEGGLRLAGTAEFADPGTAPAWGRAWLLLQQSQGYLDGLAEVESTSCTPWMGVRPSLPDGMPAIGSLPKAPQILYAFGHGHNGLTLSAITAECVAAVAGGIPPPVDLRAFSLDRFRGRAAAGAGIPFKNPDPKEKLT